MPEEKDALGEQILVGRIQDGIGDANNTPHMLRYIRFFYQRINDRRWMVALVCIGPVRN